MNSMVCARWLAAGLLLGGWAMTGCSIKKVAVNQVGNALAGSGSAFSSDDDPELVRAALPFSLKLMESLLAESPEHAGLLLAASSGFTQYAYAFVQSDADVLEETDFAAAEAERARARRLYWRAQRYGLRGLEVAHPGLGAALRAHPREAVAACTREDVPLLYWTAVAWGAAIALSKDDPGTVAGAPRMEVLIDRALALDESWNEGAIHTFLINYEYSRTDAPGDPAERARAHFRRAVELSELRLAAPFVTLAEVVSVQEQDVAEFDALLAQALAINPDAVPEHRLENLIVQRRARWLRAHKEDLFVLPPR
jgi:predicted anti-sigma-YlaC factor YlaD